MAQPFALVIAGPNGSGKTTLTAYLRDRGVDLGIYINPDEIAASLEGPPQERSLLAQAHADEKREACLTGGENFSFETVMSHSSKVDLMARARSLGFLVKLFFVGVEDPRINIERVAQRVASGGHDVPVDRIVARYQRTMALLPDAVRAAHHSILFDNTAPGSLSSGIVATGGALIRRRYKPLTPVLEARSGVKIVLTPHSPSLPAWVNRFLVQPLRERRLWP